jgi:hypothetical protein
MTRKPDVSPDKRGQLDRFKEAARALECDDDPKAFEKRVAKIAKAKPDASKSSQRH